MRLHAFSDRVVMWAFAQVDRFSHGFWYVGRELFTAHARTLLKLMAFRWLIKADNNFPQTQQSFIRWRRYF